MFIVLYGINNLGKSTQAKLLVETMNNAGYTTEYLKYPIYDLEPSGPMLNDYLRNGNPHGLSAREAQLLFALNRTQYENELQKKLSKGIHIVAEDYTGTGICWGVGAGVDEAFLTRINNHLLIEDVAFLFEGERFTQATEQTHKHETDNRLTDLVRSTHDKLGTERNWIRINANESIETIHDRLWNTIEARLSPLV